MTIATKEINRMERLDFSEIYAVYFPRMLRFACTYVIDKEEAENVVQDVFYLLMGASLFIGWSSLSSSFSFYFGQTAQH